MLISPWPTTAKRRLTAEERRTGILDAALAVFSERGYHEASIDEIAREAGRVEGAHLRALRVEAGAVRRADRAQRARADAAGRRGALSGVEVESTAERLATGLDAFFAFVEERRDAWRMLFRDAGDPESAAVLDRMVGRSPRR